MAPMGNLSLRTACRLAHLPGIQPTAEGSGAVRGEAVKATEVVAVDLTLERRLHPGQHWRTVMSRLALSLGSIHGSIGPAPPATHAHACIDPAMLRSSGGCRDTHSLYGTLKKLHVL